MVTGKIVLRVGGALDERERDPSLAKPQERKEKPWTGVRGLNLITPKGENPHDGRNPDFSDSAQVTGSILLEFRCGHFEGPTPQS